MVCCIGSLGKAGIAGRPLATNQQINSIVFDERKVMPRYGLHAVRQLKSKLEAMAPATTVAIVSKSKFEALAIPVPPLDKQRRIAAILDQADNLRRKRRETLERLKYLPSAIMDELIGNGKNATQRRLDDLIRRDDTINYGVVQPGADVEQGIPLVRVENVVGEELLTDQFEAHFAQC
jgi:type I restriction enzyme S subunit